MSFDSDVSDIGFWLVESPVNIAHGMSFDIERGNSSTWKEISAIKKVLLSLIHSLEDKKIKWFTDNQNASLVR
jgi:hypothetical protein